MGGSGGGGSGKVSYPGFMSNFHHQILDNWLDAAGDRPWADGIFPDIGSIVAAAQTSVGGNPYTGATAYDPDPEITELRNQTAVFVDSTDALWNTFLAEIISSMDLYFTAQTGSDDKVDAFRLKRIGDFNANLARDLHQWLDIGAVHTTAFPMHVANKYQREVEDPTTGFAAELQVNIEQRRHQSILEMTRIRASMMAQATEAQFKLNHMAIVAKNDEAALDTEYEKLEATWDPEIMQYAGNILSAIGGGHGAVGMNDKKQSQAMSALGGAASGAAMGSAIMPGWGTAIGAVVGAAASFL